MLEALPRSVLCARVGGPRRSHCVVRDRGHRTRAGRLSLTEIAPAGTGRPRRRRPARLPVLAPGETATITAPDGIEPQSSSWAATSVCANATSRAPNVFDARAAAVYLPPGCAVTVSTTNGAELGAAGDRRRRAARTTRCGRSDRRPAAVVARDRGHPGWQRAGARRDRRHVPRNDCSWARRSTKPGMVVVPPHKQTAATASRARRGLLLRFDRPDGFASKPLRPRRRDGRVPPPRRRRGIPTVTTRVRRTGTAVLLWALGPERAPPARSRCTRTGAPVLTIGDTNPLALRLRPPALDHAKFAGQAPDAGSPLTA